jgi:hypothetical protein
MGLIKKLVEREIDLYEAKSAISNPSLELDGATEPERSISVAAGRKLGGEQIKALKSGLEDRFTVSVRNVGPAKKVINISVQGSTLKLADVRKALRADPNAEGLSII